MKTKFSRSWKSSKQPRKQRKYRYNAPLHIKRKFMSVNLSKDLRKKYSTRNLEIRKGDTAKVMKGKFKKKTAKVSQVLLKKGKVYLDGIQVTRKDGTKVAVPFEPSNLQVLELNLDDKKRFAKLQRIQTLNQKKQNKKSE